MVLLNRYKEELEVLKLKKDYKLILLLLVPYLVGEIINRLISLGISTNSSSLTSISGIILSIWTSFGAAAYWFYVGRQFGYLRINRIKSFILGNIVWAISFVIYIWQFVLIDDANRSFPIALISQHYMLGFVGWGSRFVDLFTNTIDGSIVVIVAYTMMFITFALGFISSSKIKKRKSG